MLNELVTFFREIQAFEIVMLSIAGGIWLLLLMYAVFFGLRLAFRRPAGSGAAVVPISVVVVERNEEENLRNKLPGWLSLGYPAYEVLVVDDFSEDNSLTVVGVMRLQEQKLRLTGLNQETRYSGKLARNLALKAVSHENVVFISPDSNTPDPHWLPGIATALSGEKEIAVGYNRFSGAKGFYHQLFRTESFLQQTESMAFCINGFPFVSGEENITFDRKAYFAINGFAGKIGEEYLNLELIFNQIIRKKNNAVLLAGNLSLERDLVAGKHDFRELYYKSFILNGYLSFKIRAMRWGVNWLRALFLPFLVVSAFLCMPVWPLLAGMLLTLVIIRLIYLKRLLNRLNETGIFVISFLYGMAAPYVRIFTYWQFRNKRKN
jgi:glycosyltransferase involved in cell wall biosynthesis